MSNHSDLASAVIDCRTLELNEVETNLQQLAWKKVHHEKSSLGSVILFCIDVCSCWSELANIIDAPKVTAALQSRSATTFIWGCTDQSFYQLLLDCSISQADVDSVRGFDLPPGKVRYLILDDNGISIRNLLPKNPRGHVLS